MITTISIIIGIWIATGILSVLYAEIRQPTFPSPSQYIVLGLMGMLTAYIINQHFKAIDED